ncbi:MAG: hypothetical protein OQK82_07615 [Candidatus Pacearchaeota archaeon]|nr:hypothetical protein [Candidatus Pacearchaeota archaeon]
MRKSSAVMTKSENRIIYPCQGIAEIGTSQDHAFRWGSKEGPLITKEKASELCPRRINLFKSGEYVLCPLCQLYKDGKLELDLLK